MFLQVSNITYCLTCYDHLSVFSTGKKSVIELSKEGKKIEVVDFNDRDDAIATYHRIVKAIADKQAVFILEPIPKDKTLTGKDQTKRTRNKGRSLFRGSKD